MLNELKRKNYSVKCISDNILKEKYIGSSKKLAILFDNKSSSEDFLLNILDLSTYEEIRIFNLNKERE